MRCTRCWDAGARARCLPHRWLRFTGTCPPTRCRDLGPLPTARSCVATYRYVDSLRSVARTHLDRTPRCVTVPLIWWALLPHALPRAGRCMDLGCSLRCRSFVACWCRYRTGRTYHTHTTWVARCSRCHATLRCVAVAGSPPRCRVATTARCGWVGCGPLPLPCVAVTGCYVRFTCVTTTLPRCRVTTATRHGTAVTLRWCGAGLPACARTADVEDLRCHLPTLLRTLIPAVPYVAPPDAHLRCRARCVTLRCTTHVALPVAGYLPRCMLQDYVAVTDRFTLRTCLWVSAAVLLFVVQVAFLRCVLLPFWTWFTPLPPAGVLVRSEFLYTFFYVTHLVRYLYLR